MRVRSLCYVLSPSQGGFTTGWSLHEGTETPEQSSLFWEPFCALGLKCYLTSQPSDDSLSFSIISVFTVSSVSQSFFPLLPSVSPCLPFWPQVSSFCSLPFHFLKSQSRKEAGRSELVEVYSLLHTRVVQAVATIAWEQWVYDLCSRASWLGVQDCQEEHGKCSTRFPAPAAALPTLRFLSPGHEFGKT